MIVNSLNYITHQLVVNMLTLLLFILGSTNHSHGFVYDLQYGILKAVIQETGETHKFCLHYYKGLTELPFQEKDVELTPLSNGMNWTICKENTQPDFPISSTTVFIENQPNCSLVDATLEAQSYGAHGTYFVGNSFQRQINSSTNSSANLGLVSRSTYWSIMNFTENSTVHVGSYTSKSSRSFFEKYSPFILIWFIAVFSIMVGAFWSGVVRNSLYQKEQVLIGSEVGPNCDTLQRNPEDEPSLRLTPKVIVCIVLMMCVVLVGIWLLLQYIIYLFIVLFVVACISALYCCFEPLVLKIPCGKCRTPYFNIYVVRGVLEARQVILLLFSIAIPIIWVVYRRESWAWILQDCLGITFSINVMVKIRLPNLMICTLLLTLLVLYDIFFVFITPFITPGGTSIMVDVAQGGGSEELPMVVKVPFFIYPEFYDYCNLRNYSLLGFGDILVPGLLVSFVHSFDLKLATPFRLYYVTGVVAYGCGLLLTFVGLYVMAAPQPALFYLVPSLLIPTVVIAAVRGELAAMWSDSPRDLKNGSVGSHEEHVEEGPYSNEDVSREAYSDSPSARPVSQNGSLYDTSSSRSGRHSGSTEAFRGNDEA